MDLRRDAMDQLEVLNPVASVAINKSSLARRLKTLENKRIALYWTGKPGGDIALGRIRELLEHRFKNVEFELIRSGTPGPKKTVEYAATFQGVIGGFGD